jgi:hypothetical protein
MSFHNEADEKLREKYENILTRGNVEQPQIEKLLEEMRELILFSGLPSETEV